MHSAALVEEFRALQKQNPASCGDWLRGLQKQHKLNQTQLAERLKANRQVIGRYLKATKAKKSCHSVSRKDHAPAVSAHGSEPSGPAQSLTWLGVFKNIIKPAPFFCLLAIAGFTSYLIQQGILFFEMVEADNQSIISSAILAEAIPLISAACFALSFKKSHKILLGIIFGGSIVGMGFFMHASIGQQMTAQSDVSKQTHLEKRVLNSSLTALSESLSALPENYVSKRQELIQQINFQRAELGKLDTQTGTLGQAISLTSNAAFTFGVWLRVAAMLLNALLVHWVVGRLTT